MTVKWIKDGNLRKDLQKFCIFPKSLDELSSILCKHGVDLNKWGVGQAKGLPDLYKEIKRKESQLILLPKNKLRRFVRVAFVDIFYYNEGKKYKLVEEYRLFVDGRKRSGYRPASLGEKLLPYEDFLSGALRGVKEELGLAIERERFVERGTYFEEKDSPSYPGLVCLYAFGKFELLIRPAEFKTRYEEKEGGEVVVFGWEDLA